MEAWKEGCPGSASAQQRTVILCCRKDIAGSHRRGTGGRCWRALGSGQFTKEHCGAESPLSVLRSGQAPALLLLVHTAWLGVETDPLPWCQPRSPGSELLGRENGPVRAAPQRAGLSYSPGPAHLGTWGFGSTWILTGSPATCLLAEISPSDLVA